MFTSANEFSMHIESMAYNGHMSYTDAVLRYCTEHFLEPDDVASLVGKSLKEKIAVEMRECGLLPKQATLDV